MAKSIFNWVRDEFAGYRAEMPGNITLVVSPDCATHFGTKPKRGTTWRAQASHWDERTRTISRFGRDEYNTRHPNWKSAQSAAESIYLDATAESVAP